MTEEEVELPPQAPTGYVQCPVSECGAVVKSKGQYTHFRNVHPNLDYQEYRDKFIPAPPPEPLKPPEEPPLYKGELDTTAILRDILSKHPDIPKRAVDEICSWSDYGPIHPTQLIYLLSSIRGVSTTTANVVAQKYSLALQKAQMEGRMQLPPAFYYPIQQQGPTPQMGPWPTLQQPFLLPTAPQAPSGMVGPQTAPQLVTPQLAPQGYPFLTREEYEKKEKERAEKTEMSNLRDRVDKLDKDFAGALSGLEERLLEKFETVGAFGAPSQFEEVKEYIDKKGEVCDPEKAVSVRVRRIPIREERKGALEQFKDLKEAGLIATPKDVLDMIEKAKPKVEKAEPIEEHPVVKELKERATKTEEKLEKERDERLKTERELREKEEERRHKETLEAIKSMRQPVTGVTTTEGVLATAITEAGRREPIRVIVEGAKDVLGQPGVTPTPPPSGPAGEIERGGVLQGLRPHGLVTKVVERVRG